MSKIIGVYKITNTITNDFYIGSSKNVKQRWKDHKCKSRWSQHPNNPMYLDFQKYGVDKFEFEIIAEVEVDKLKEMEQRFIEALKPTYNSNNANGLNIDKRKEWQKEYEKTDKYKEYRKEYEKSDKRKKRKKEYNKEYNNQLCCYNGETLTLSALYTRFRRSGMPNPLQESKKYLIGGSND